MKWSVTALIFRLKITRIQRETSGLASSSISKIVLVGGPTQIPYVRRRLESDLGIATDTTVDPLTVVARGACIFALSQKIPQKAGFSTVRSSPDSYSLELNYESLTAEVEQTVSGSVSGLKEGLYSALIQSDTGDFTTDRIPLRKGKFFSPITLVANTTNLFWIYIIDSKDQPLEIEPNSFTVTHGLSIAGAPLPHTIGVAVSGASGASRAGNADVFDKLIEKGTILPAEKTKSYKTARTLKKTQDKNLLWIRVGEGESEIADRNAYVCELGIKGSELPKDLPEGTEVRLTIKINEIRELQVSAYLPAIDLTLNARATFRDELVQIDDLEKELDAQIERARSSASNFSRDQRNRIATELETAEASLRNARNDEDEKRKAVKQVRDLKSSLDEAQKQIEMPELIKQFNEAFEAIGQAISEIQDAGDRSTCEGVLSEIGREGAQAIALGDKILLKGINERLMELGARAYGSNPSNWRDLFHITVSEGNFANDREAARVIERGNLAIQRNDLEELKLCCRALGSLKKSESPKDNKSNSSGIRR